MRNIKKIIKLLPSKHRRIAQITLAVLLLIGALVQAFYPEQYTGLAYVIDGDTIELEGQRIRLFGIDAPESPQSCFTDSLKWPCGCRATEALRELTRDKKITCIVEDTDRYGRKIAVCYLDELDINGWMVSKGWAIAYTYYTPRYATHQKQAQGKNLNIWNSEFIEPYRWRKGDRIKK